MADPLNRIALTDYTVPIRADDGKLYRVFAGTIRNTGAPNYWQLIVDAGHQPVGITSVTSSASTITINHPIGAKTIGAITVVPDETLAGLGYFAGASGGLSSSTISLGRTPRSISDMVSYDGTNWVSQNGLFTVDSFTAGVLVLSHPAVIGASGNVSVGSRGGSRRAVLAAASPPISATQTKIEFYDNTGTLVTTPDTGMRALVSRFDRNSTVNPQTEIDPVAYPSHNLWIIGVHEIDP